MVCPFKTDPMENEIQNETLAETQTETQNETLIVAQNEAQDEALIESHVDEVQDEILDEAQPESQSEAQPESKTTKCLNCGTEFEGNFCPECGQSADTGRFTMRFIFENLVAAFTSKDGGLWFTLKNLFTRPGAMIIDNLNGKRKRYFSPFPLLFFALTVYILLYSVTGSRSDLQQLERKNLEMEIESEAEPTVDLTITDADGNKTPISIRKYKIRKIIGQGFKFYNHHYTAVFMLTLPFFLMATRAWYGKNNRKRYFRAEYLVAIAYSMVMVVIYRCLASIAYLFSPSVSDSMGEWVFFVIVAAFTACFHKMLGFSIAKTAWRSLLAVVLYYIIMGSVLLFGCIIAYFILRKRIVVGG